MLTDETVDWHHARVEPRDDGWTVVDLTGERRTEVNGMKVSELLLSPEEADRYIRQAFASKNAWARATACQIVGERQLHNYADQIGSLVEDPDPFVSTMAGIASDLLSIS